MSVPVNCSPPQLKHCFMFWSALARFDFGQGFSLVQVARGCVCNRGVTYSDRLVEKAICTDTDQMGALPLKSAVWLVFCIPAVMWQLRVMFSSCPGVHDTQWCWWVWHPTFHGSLLLTWRDSLYGEASRAGGPGLGIQNPEYWHSRLFKPWARLWSFVRNWQCMATESWSAGITHSFIPLSSSGYGQLALVAPRRQKADKGGEESQGLVSLPPLLVVLLKYIVVVQKLLVGINKCWIILGFKGSLYFHFLYDLLVPANLFPYKRGRTYSLELYIWCGKFALIHFHAQLDWWAVWPLNVIPFWFLLRLFKCALCWLIDKSTWNIHCMLQCAKLWAEIQGDPDKSGFVFMEFNLIRGTEN